MAARPPRGIGRGVVFSRQQLLPGFGTKRKVLLGSAEEEMPISHKIRQYRALLGFAHPGEILWSTEQAEEVAPKQDIWQGFMHQILVGSLRGG